MIKLSMGLPFFRSKYIGWAALESLCRQEAVDFEWELIVLEEHKDEAMGEKEILSYTSRLQDVGCTRIEYHALDKWVPLAVKLKRIINLFGDTEIAIWNPDDYYAPPKLLNTAYNVLTEKSSIDWFSIPKTIFYNIADGKTLIYDVWATKQRRKDDSTGRAFRTPLLKAASNYFDNRLAVCDGMVRETYKKALGRPINMYFDYTNNWKYGLNIKGLNNVSKGQSRWFNNIRSPLFECNVELDKHIPADVLNKLLECKKFLSKHKRGLR